MTKRTTRQRGSIRVHRGGIELRAYAGIDPTTGRQDYLEERLPPGTKEDDKLVGVRLTALVGRADAIAADRRARRKGEVAPDPAPDPDRTVGAALEAWWRMHGRHRARAGDARTIIDAYLLPRLETVALWRLHPGLDPEAAAAKPDLFDLTTMFDDLRRRGSVGGGGRTETAGGPLGPRSLQKIKGVLSATLALEVKGGRLKANPCAGVKLASAGARPSTTPTPDEMTAFQPYLAGAGYTSGGYTTTRRVRGGAPGATVTYEVALKRLEPALRDRQLLVYAWLVASGPRPTEVSALQRGAYDRTTGRMSFAAEGVVRIQEKGQPERWEIARGETDKRRARVIELDHVLCGDLDRLLLEQDEVALACGAKLGRRAWLFSPAPDCSTFLTPNTASDGFGAAVKRAVAAGVDLPPSMTIYSMRHYGITQLLRAGRAPAAVAVRFATSETMIRKTYSHAIPADDSRLAETMAILRGPLPAGPGDVVSIEERRKAAEAARPFLNGR